MIESCLLEVSAIGSPTHVVVAHFNTPHDFNCDVKNDDHCTSHKTPKSKNDVDKYKVEECWSIILAFFTPDIDEDANRSKKYTEKSIKCVSANEKVIKEVRLVC